MRELDNLAVKAKSDTRVSEQLLQRHEAYILACASKVCHRYVTKNDDEWSVSMIAFAEAIDSYELNKGSFLSFSKLVIKRRLLDYFRSQNKYKNEITVDPYIFDSEPEEEVDDVAIRMAVAETVNKKSNEDLRLEIKAINDVLEAYSISFLDLTKCSPRADKTKRACAKAINYILSNPILISELHDTKLLPLKLIEKNSEVPRKILERHRKYIIAAIEILSGEYPSLAEYLCYVRKEKDI